MRVPMSDNCPMAILLVSDMRETPGYSLHDSLNTSFDHRAAGTTENTPPISPNLQ
jgi:hypothetical protein